MKIISYDLFDTLVGRLVAKPVDVFYLTGMRAGLPNDIEISRFANIRKKTESQLRKKLKREVTLEEIYNEIKKIRAYEEEKVNVLREAEIETENIVLYPITENVNELINANGYDLKCIISDTYFQKVQIKKLLDGKLDISGIEIFCSSDYLENKSSGKLFEKIKSLIQPEKIEGWVHVGDNYVSDYVQAKKHGIDSRYFDSRLRDSAKKNNINQSLVYGISKYVQESNKNECVSEAYIDVLSNWLLPTLLGFARNVIDEAKKRDCKIYCLARDGFLPYVIIKKICQSENVQLDVRYIHVSRKSLLPVALHSSEWEIFVKNWIFEGKSSVSKNEIADILNCDAAELTNLKEKIEFNELLVLGKSYLCKISENEYRKAKAYLNSQEIEQSDILVDLGWRGLLQKAIELEIEKKVCGMYIGCTENHGSEMHGYYTKVLPSEVLLLEKLFISNHGTTIGYQRVGEELVPNFGKKSEHNEKEIEFLLKVVDVYLDRFDWCYIDEEMHKESYRKALKKYCYFPTELDINLWLNKSHNSSLANISADLIELSPTQKLFSRERHGLWVAGSITANFPQFIRWILHSANYIRHAWLH